MYVYAFIYLTCNQMPLNTLMHILFNFLVFCLNAITHSRHIPALLPIYQFSPSIVALCMLYYTVFLLLTLFVRRVLVPFLTDEKFCVILA